MMTKLSPIIFKVDDRTYRVKKKTYRQTDFENDTAYIISDLNDYIYPYRGKINNLNEIFAPGLYKHNSKIYCKFPSSDEEKRKYNKSKLIILTPDSIFKDLNSTVLEELPDNINTDGDVFKPVIKNTDDIALAGMKYAIGKKNINFNAYSSRFSDVATKNNGRRALTHGSTLKMDMLTRFADVFDINAALILWDKYGCQNPMSEKYNKAYIIFNDDAIDLKDPNIEIEEIRREDD